MKKKTKPSEFSDIVSSVTALTLHIFCTYVAEILKKSSMSIYSCSLCGDGRWKQKDKLCTSACTSRHLLHHDSVSLTQHGTCRWAQSTGNQIQGTMGDRDPRRKETKPYAKMNMICIPSCKQLCL